MNRKFALLAIPVLALTACTQRGYKAEPVVSANDVRETEVPDLGDEDAIKQQDCFLVEVFADGWGYDSKKVGVACIVEDDDGEP